MRTLIVTMVLISMRWLDITTCSSPGGYKSTGDSVAVALMSGQDSEGSRWWNAL